MENIIKSLTNSQRIVIIPHVFADGDALGSSLALAIGLKSLGKEVIILTNEEIPANVDFLPQQQLLQLKELKEFNYDTALSIDTGDIHQLDWRKDVYLKAAVKINIDHHVTNSIEADFKYTDTSASATGEIIFDLLGKLGVKITD